MSRAAAVVRKYATTSAVSLRNRTAYFSNYFGSLVTYGLFVFVFSRVWTAAFAGKAVIAGYTREAAIWYFIVAELAAFGFGRFYWGLSRDMKSGQVAYLLIRPYGFVAYHFFERMGPALVDTIVLAAEGFALGTLFAGPPPVANSLAAIAVVASLLLAGSLQYFLQMTIAMTAFWLEENAAFFWIYQKLSLVVGTLVPLEFLPDTARKVASWTPFAYLAYPPARIFVAWDPRDAASLLLSQAAWVLGAALLAKAVFLLGSRSVSVNGG
ncbi:MAG: ABC-2 family transporter protein [Spirochaetes bacterium]|nr:ABC-2 family transporter protein [Spirochaetota bacterium]